MLAHACATGRMENATKSTAAKGIREVRLLCSQPNNSQIPDFPVVERKCRFALGELKLVVVLPTMEGVPAVLDVCFWQVESKRVW